jgi:hypothetical protein
MCIRDSVGSEMCIRDRSRTFVRVDYSNRFIVEMYIDKKNSDYSEWSLRTAKLVRKNGKNGG